MVFYQVFLLSLFQCILYSRNCKRLSEFEEIEIPRQSCRDDYDFSADIGLQTGILTIKNIRKSRPKQGLGFSPFSFSVYTVQ
jgi:hypothetical protein